MLDILVQTARLKGVLTGGVSKLGPIHIGTSGHSVPTQHSVIGRTFTRLDDPVCFSSDMLRLKTGNMQMSENTP